MSGGEHLDELLEQERELQLERFDNEIAWELGQRLVAAARERGLAVTIDVCRGEQQLFHCALPGTSADNDAWIIRKNRVVRRFGHSSFYMGSLARSQGREFGKMFLLDERDFAAHGGAFPASVRGVGVVGTITVSGLPQEEDHRLVVDVLREFVRASHKENA